ncbi:hypothetical protein KZJ38_22425 [Paraburkholderia edwinii]|jgi:hypothetical protein|uniref:Secreted protein n=1 Tax=Paraburkholderia edwinii TaxID=2861782 RepID=A0ABX8UU12_9BURK|nr:hypothetical protein [Paraburkholderia edwinii]QYD72482.1 hypothetical protein KZJ38_22425 [Paraburkholderia edwinii]
MFVSSLHRSPLLANAAPFASSEGFCLVAGQLSVCIGLPAKPARKPPTSVVNRTSEGNQRIMIGSSNDSMNRQTSRKLKSDVA